MKITVVPPEPVKPKFNLEVSESELTVICSALNLCASHFSIKDVMRNTAVEMRVIIKDSVERLK